MSRERNTPPTRLTATHSYSRRSCLAHASHASVLAAGYWGASRLGLSPRRADAAEDVAKRLILVTYPNGAILRRWHLGGTTLAADGRILPRSALSFALDPLRPYANFLMPLRHLNTLGHGGSSSHPEAASRVLSGGNTGQPSIEVSVALELNSRSESPLPLPYIHLGLFTRYNKGKEYLMFRDANGQPIFPEDDPVKAARILFGAEAADTPDTDRQKVILQQLIADAGRKAECCPAGGLAAAKLRAHVSSLVSYLEILENRKPGGSCRPTQLTGMTTDQRSNNTLAEDIVRSQWRNIVAAASCGITRVFGFSFMSAQDDSLYINFNSIKDLLDGADGGGFGSDRKWWNQNQSHSSSHEANEVFAVQNRWYNMMIAELLEMLRTTPDPESNGARNLLDSTVVCVVSENGESANHGQEDVGWYLAGGANSRFMPGRVLECSGRGSSDLLLELARIMGLDWSTYARSSGGLPGLARA